MAESSDHEYDDGLGPAPGDDTREGVAKARELAEAEGGHYRHPAGWQRFAVPVVAVAWSIFQLSTVFSFFQLDAVAVRAIHLAFALFIVFLEAPFLKRRHWGPEFLWKRDRLPVADWLLSIGASLCALYIVFDYAQLNERLGQPLPRDIVIGILLLVVLLEATRRVIGPALSLVALAFVLYAFFGEHVPRFLSFRAPSLQRLIGQVTMTTEGIYGIPLDVSAKTVFMFVLLGAMLDRAGGGRFFIRLALSLLGSFRGGPAKAAVLASGMTGMVSGSSIANIVTTGTFTIPLMKKVGYPARKAAAIEVAASTDGQIAPPIMGAAAFIIAEYVGVPYLEVVKAAAIPAFASYVALLYITHLEACKLGLKGIPRSELPRFRPVLAEGMHFLLPLGVLIWGLVIRRFTPNTAAFHAVWVMAVVMLIQHPLRAWRRQESISGAVKQGLLELIGGMSSGARAMVPVALACATAGIIVGIVGLGVGGRITAIIEVASFGNIFLMLLVTAIVSLMIGMGLPTTATYIVVASLVAPAIVDVAGVQNVIIPLISAHLFCFYFGILADDTPPVGLAAYAAAAIAKSPPIGTGVQAFIYDVRTAILPFMFVFNSDLILYGITSWPQGLLIFAMTCAGAMAFAAATQGWLFTANRPVELVLLLAVTFILMQPGVIAWGWSVPHDYRYWCYLPGLAIFAIVYVAQRRRAAMAG